VNASTRVIAPEIVLFNIDREYLETVRLGVMREFPVDACQIYRPVEDSAQVTIVKPRPGYRTMVVVDSGAPQAMRNPSSAAEHLTKALCRETHDFIVAVILPRSTTYGSYFLDLLRREAVAAYEIWPPERRTHVFFRRRREREAGADVGRRIRQIWNEANGIGSKEEGGDDSTDSGPLDGTGRPPGGSRARRVGKLLKEFLDATGAPGDPP
jgi:hypothetical protein